MKKKLILGALAVCFILGVKAQTATTDPNQPQLIEKVTAVPGQMIIPYEKWKLPNGLLVIVSEDHSDPIVHIEVTYHVGSAREASGKSGFAHFFEHMLFQGSEHVGKGEHFKIVEGNGGTMNGNTTHDRTSYFEIVPKNYLETALWLESDRMGFLLDSVTQKKFENQRATVKNERGQNVDNRPYGRTDELKDQIMYPPTHPYSWPVIGHIEDLNRVGVDDLKNFFMRWYGPNNASLVVVGDVNPSDVVKLAMKYFGPIQKCPDVRKQRVESFRLPENVYANYGDKVWLPMLAVTYPTVPSYHTDEAALDVLSFVLGNGNNSILYKNFVKSEKTAQASSNHSTEELAGEFSFTILSYPDGEIDVEKLLAQTLEEFDKTGVDDDALLRAKNQFESGILQNLGTVSEKANLLYTWNYLLGSKPWNVDKELERYNKVTKEDVMRVYHQYIYDAANKKPRNAAIVNVFPKHEKFTTNAAVNSETKKEETKFVSTSGDSKQELEYKGLTYKKAVDNFDRSKQPVAGSPVFPMVPKTYQSKFDNGLTVIGTQSDESPYVNILLQIRGGNYAAGNDLSKSGHAFFTSMMMEEGTQKYTSEQFSNEIEKLGASINFSSGNEFTSVWLTTPKKNLDKALALFEEKLLHPKFAIDDFKRLQKMLGASISQRKQSANAMAGEAYSKLLYGKSIASESPMGTIKSLKGLQLKDVQSYYDNFYAPNLANLVIVGDISENDIMPKLSFLKGWKKKDTQLPEVTITPQKIEKTKIYLVDKYKAPQSIFIMGYSALPYDWNGKFYKANIMNYPLGAQFNSRLNMNLREDKGHTYGIRSYFSGSKYPGTFSISASVKDSTTDASVKEIIYEVKKFSENGLTDEEIDFTKKAIILSDALRFEGNNQKAGFLNSLLVYNLPKNYIEEQNKVLQGLSKTELNALAKELLPYDKMIIVVVGDKDLIGDKLKKLGYDVVDYQVD